MDKLPKFWPQEKMNRMIFYGSQETAGDQSLQYLLFTQNISSF